MLVREALRFPTSAVPTNCNYDMKKPKTGEKGTESRSSETSKKNYHWKNQKEWRRAFNIDKTTLDTFVEELLGTFISPFTKTGAKYENLRFNRKAPTHDTYPWAIIKCLGVVDIQATLKFVLTHKIPFCVRSGGHCYNGYSVVDKGVVIDMRKINHIVVSENREFVDVGPGVRLERLYKELKGYNLIVPGGTCPDVAIGGLSMGGGYGYASRKIGLTCDSLVGLTMVTAQGKEDINVDVTSASESYLQDLLWAHKGGRGGNFGVVVSLKFRTHKVENVWAMSIMFPKELAAEAFLAWQSNYTHDPNWQKRDFSDFCKFVEFSSFLNFTWLDTSKEGMQRRWKKNTSEDIKTTKDKENRENNTNQIESPKPPTPTEKKTKACVEIDGMYLNGEADIQTVRDHFKPLLDVYALSTDEFWREEGPKIGLLLKKTDYGNACFWLNDCEEYGEDEDNEDDDDDEEEFSEQRSSYVTRPWTHYDVKRLFAYFETAKSDGFDFTMESYGGLINCVPPEKTAFIHRDAYFNVVLTAVWDGVESTIEEAHDFVDDAFIVMRELSVNPLDNKLSPMISTQAYQNYPVPDRNFSKSTSKVPVSNVTEVLNSYYGSNLPKLQQIKKKFDPDNHFRYRQSIPLPIESSVRTPPQFWMDPHAALQA